MNQKPPSRIDLIGQNGGDGLHYGKPECFMSNPDEEEQLANGCHWCMYRAECYLAHLNNKMA